MQVLAQICSYQIFTKTFTYIFAGNTLDPCKYINNNIKKTYGNIGLLWFICLLTYQHLMGNLMLKFNLFINLWLLS